MFLDDSNIWISAKKYACSHSGLNTHLDPRVRLDMGKLIKQILGDRLLIRCKIYGSEAPPHDSFWNLYKEYGEVFTFPRSAHHREKRVDTQMSSDIVDTAHTSPFSMLVVVGTGDCDLLSPIEIVMARSP